MLFAILQKSFPVLFFMPQKIRVLDDNTINKIAAGEVIENPASVVKELVDNAIDAGATEITVEISLGGRKKIAVSDNGCGMAQDDALLSLERHATSKICSIEDMITLGTLGFRGEAIPSIASISHFSLLTNAKGQKEQATFVKVQGGKILFCTPSVRDRGTTITVEHLFFNVPVRKKFQRSSLFDAQEVQKVLSRLQLSHPEVAIRLISDGKTLLKGKKADTHGLELFHKRAEELFGKELLDSFVPVSLEKDPFFLTALFSKPTVSRPTRSFQHIIVNGRPIYSKQLSNFVQEGYSTLLQEGRQPLFLLSLTMPADLLDVNVHPQKKEVRLRQENTLKSLLLEAVEKAFRKENPSISSSFSPKEENVFCSPSPLSFSTKRWRSFDLEEKKPSTPFFQENFSFPIEEKSADSPLPYTVLTSISSYLVLQSTQHLDDLAILDIQRAKKRIFFEELEKKEGVSSMQALLIPQSVQVPKELAAKFSSLLPFLEKSGLKLEQSGPSSFSLQALSSLFSHNPLSSIQEALLDLLDLDTPSFTALQEDLSRKLFISSSKSTLSLVEAEALLKTLFFCKQPLYCPKGEAIFYSLNPEKLAKLMS